MGGVVPMAPGERVGLRAFTASWSFALLSFARASGMAGASDWAACCSWGVPWGRDARVEVRKWWFGTMMSTDATEDYLVKFNVNWLKSYCPKIITIERNEYLGPFKTEIEMKAALSNVNRAT